MGKTYAIADLHGRYDLMLKALEAIKKDADPENKGEEYFIVFLGDYVDRGPNSHEIIKRLIKGAEDNATWVILKGNHEDMMVTCLRKEHEIGWWLGNGGKATLFSYGHPRSGEVKYDVVPTEHLEFLDNLFDCFPDKYRVFVHGALEENVSIEDQKESMLLWGMYGMKDTKYFDKHVVHGHEQHKDGPILLPGRTDLDTLAWLTGRLVVGVFDDDIPGGPTKTIEIKGSTYAELKGDEINGSSYSK